MLHSAVGQTSDEFNEVSVSSQRAEHLQASDSSHCAEQPSLEVSVEQYRQLDSSAIAELDRSSFESIPNIERQPRSRGTSPTSIDSGAGQPMRSRSQSSETYSRGRSRHRKRSNRDHGHHRSRDRRSQHRSPCSAMHPFRPTTGRHSTTYQTSSANHVLGEHPRHQSIVVQVSR